MPGDGTDAFADEREPSGGSSPVVMQIPSGPVGFAPQLPKQEPTDENYRAFMDPWFTDAAKGFSYLEPHMRGPTSALFSLAMQLTVMGRMSDPDFNRKSDDPKWVNAPPQPHEPGYELWRIGQEYLAVGPSVGGVGRRLWAIIKRNQPAIGYGGGLGDERSRWGGKWRR